jgi:transposase
VDPKLLAPIQHRGEKAQQDLAVIRARAGLVEARTKLINTVRGLVKPMGERLKKCDAEQVGEGMLEGMSEAARRTLGSLMRCIEKVNEEVGKYDEQIEEIGKEYGELKLLTQVHGVGTLTALTYLLTIDDANRFVHSRDVGPYLGLRPRQKESGQSRPELGISKAGDRLLRSYLVQAAHCNLRKNAPESDLRTWGTNKAGTGKRAKRRAVVAMARKLGVLLNRLWVTGEVYDPHYNLKAEEQRTAKKAKQAA